ncbi:NUDIX hydrolase [Catenovulum maritimum]|uniref:Phosphatase NudJ n=1 Tax=Catenovulum maritimum TaxID=1513271 RepID=A0A0J8GRG0_9ALTE|nr:NUDIX hydrolase [Catenovulum maritimum]KMT65287.1 phosphatase [Catenovulum maritimum]
MFKPNTTVACVVVCQDKFLLVEETEDGKQVYNQPAGHLEADESLLDAAKRELYEETGLSLDPEYLLGVYQSQVKDKGIQYLRFCYVIELDGDYPETNPQDSDITAAHWLTYKEIEAKQDQLRSPMVKICIDDYRQGYELPLESVKTYF